MGSLFNIMGCFAAHDIKDSMWIIVKRVEDAGGRVVYADDWSMSRGMSGSWVPTAVGKLSSVAFAMNYTSPRPYVFHIMLWMEAQPGLEPIEEAHICCKTDDPETEIPEFLRRR